MHDGVSPNGTEKHTKIPSGSTQPLIGGGGEVGGVIDAAKNDLKTAADPAPPDTVLFQISPEQPTSPAL
jgi:hypothetical protein